LCGQERLVLLNLGGWFNTITKEREKVGDDIVSPSYCRRVKLPDQSNGLKRSAPQTMGGEEAGQGEAIEKKRLHRHRAPSRRNDTTIRRGETEKTDLTGRLGFRKRGRCFSVYGEKGRCREKLRKLELEGSGSQEGVLPGKGKAEETLYQ